MAAEKPTPPKKQVAPETDDLEVSLVETANEKMVTVRALVDHKCSIGGRKYYMRKHAEYQMPDSDAAILQYANKVMKK